MYIHVFLNILVIKVLFCRMGTTGDGLLSVVERGKFLGTFICVCLTVFVLYTPSYKLVEVDKLLGYSINSNNKGKMSTVLIVFASH